MSLTETSLVNKTYKYKDFLNIQFVWQFVIEGAEVIPF